MGIDLNKVEEKAPQLLSLTKKAQQSLNQRGLDGTKARVALVADYSGSMRQRYNSNSVQNLAEKVLSLSFLLDDDGEVDVFLFDSGADHVGTLNLDNYVGGIDRLTSGRRMGTTNYAKAFDAVSEFYNLTPKTVKSGGLFSKKTTLAPVQDTMPVFAVFLTDGSPDSKPAAIEAITRLSYAPIFWKFLSVGSENIQFLQKLDDLDDRYIDNADYKPIGEVESLDDQNLFDALADEYADYLREAKRLNLLS